MSEIRLSHYDPRWPQAFEQLRSSVLMSCEGWVVEVHHVGSTAISGLIARPVIDAVAVLDDAEGWGPALTLIEGLNFVCHPPDARLDWLGNGQMMVKPRHGDETHRLHLFLRDDPVAAQMLRVRDRLRSDRELAFRFEDAKVSQWRSLGCDPNDYARWKHDFFGSL